MQPIDFGLLQRDRLAERNSNLAGRRDRPETAREQQQLTPRVDQQTDLIVDLQTHKHKHTDTTNK